MPTQLTFTFYGDAQFDRYLENIELRGQDASPVWEHLADRFLELERAQFATEGAAHSGGWSPLSPPYAAWKQRHYPGKTILRRTDELFESLTEGPDIRIVTAQDMWIGSGVEHGKYHQRGAGVPQRRPIELVDAERKRWARDVHRFLVTGQFT